MANLSHLYATFRLVIFDVPGYVNSHSMGIQGSDQKNKTSRKLAFSSASSGLLTWAGSRGRLLPLSSGACRGRPPCLRDV
uniref:Uncharacterized protein n=1 Tax=Rhipicephalus appendiculatus TaxID=34631 RepID=A0A131YFD5_RHIAP